ncbi:unknown [Clostridium sp. CAG:557]|nr:unknown [Clostridium sp. CAG:557]
MGTALISQRSSRYTTIKFENYGTGPTLSKGTATSLSVCNAWCGHKHGWKLCIFWWGKQ